MGTILDEVQFTPYERPKYTISDLSQMVIGKRKSLNESVTELAERLGIEEELLMQIEGSPSFFNVEMYKACSRILEIPIKELLKKEREEPVSISYRQKKMGCGNKETYKTIELANIVFQEMVLQRKINHG
ncbi:helix-turn-helix transcriptional regulator [Turicibacter sanguinis]|uniref:helix-turn-helix transcriptional regulator n=1 Tax=Turicibacter sanguinis TaxID=154288 RepID=UPI0006C41E09|nr:helix-turn-helix transcriptional regulator [Turicibacter sanguinis]MDB8555559.1 helix-turn-helix transcriptional regulator [Turicibacter sanguinis]MDB8575892.1 helix-turn-helix transcriptional regulator [Turicibacter sanguinis]MDB8578544.1 helix-turn-helix transcriptional regulator [Turicibacter sanguinis]MDB8584479.1 helix-turn-helix transcriptional regulator [Turicibacter sanguinis]MDB8587474.1 helix-turn-helix transcriptional regulator [Turicibacter sanguinis]